MDEQQSPSGQQAPYPGSKEMPQWNTGELIDAPKFDRKKWFAMLGPGLLMGGAAIGGGEWLMGPTVTARYGGALMWLGALSILGQMIYNIEISRYALYTGEPIFTGKFRTLPGPMFWLFMYLMLDFGAVFPYLAATASTPVAAIYLGKMPDPTNPAHQSMLQWIAYGIFILSFIPLIFGGKVYNSLKAVMTFKIFAVLGFLLVLGVFYSHASTWTEIFTGFVKIGNVPIQKAEDQNGNGILDEGEEDWDSDQHADVVEMQFTPTIDSDPADKDKTLDSFDLNQDGTLDQFIELGRNKQDNPVLWPDFDGDGTPDATVRIKGEAPIDLNYENRGKTAFVTLDTSGNRKPDFMFIDYDGDGTRDGDAIDNVFLSILRGDGLPDVDLSMIAFLAAFAAIAGSGGLTNAPVSNYTRDQGWGMGHHVGAIPSVVGGHDIQLSHEGTVFEPTDEAMPRWRRWYKHILRDQMVVWMPACFFGIALPSMLSMEFLKRGTVANQWTAAGMTADGVFEAVSKQSGQTVGNIFWFMTLFCGFLVLAPSMAATIDGFVRRWVDVFWTGSKRLRQWEPHRIKHLFFGVLCGYFFFGLIMLSMGKPMTLILISTNIMNFALGFSCWHTIYVNHSLLPKRLRPGIFMTGALFCAGLFFWVLATLSLLKNLEMI